MKIYYKCNKCNKKFNKPLLLKGVFVCPKCKKPDFIKVHDSKVIKSNYIYLFLSYPSNSFI